MKIPLTTPTGTTAIAKILILSAFVLLLTANFGQATVREYFAPRVDGKRLDSCLADARDCGKPAADAFCKIQGFDFALLFQREAVADTIRLANGGLCSGASCNSFKQIKCATLKPTSTR